MYVAIGGRWMYLWRAIDQNGEVLDILIQARPDKWRAYGAAFRELGLTAWHHQAKWKNNR